MQPEDMDHDALVAEVRRLRANQWPEWSQMLTNQSCEKGKHSDWFIDSEHSHRCPWCALDALQAERDAARAEAEELRETVDELTQSTSDLGRDLLIEGERADAAVAEAGRVREALQRARADAFREAAALVRDECGTANMAAKHLDRLADVAVRVDSAVSGDC